MRLLTAEDILKNNQS